MMALLTLLAGASLIFAAEQVIAIAVRGSRRANKIESLMVHTGFGCLALVLAAPGFWMVSIGFRGLFPVQ